jgi:hypothetical protein
MLTTAETEWFEIEERIAVVVAHACDLRPAYSSARTASARSINRFPISASISSTNGAGTRTRNSSAGWCDESGEEDGKDEALSFMPRTIARPGRFLQHNSVITVRDLFGPLPLQIRPQHLIGLEFGLDLPKKCFSDWAGV